MSEVLVQQADASPSASSTRRKSSISLIVLHYDPRTAAEARAAFTAKGASLAPHYFVGADGVITQFVRESRAAQHSGTATWNKHRRDIDRISIGIMLEQHADTPYSDDQLIALHRLIDAIQERYKLTDAAIAAWTPSDKPPLGTLALVVPPPPPLDVSDIPIGPMVLGEETPDYGLWAFLQGQTYTQRGGSFKYTVNDLAHSQAFPVYATKNDLGAPVGPNEPTPVAVNGVTYNYQAFARATIFNEGRNYSAVQNLNSLLDDAIPDTGAARALLEASYRSSLAVTDKSVQIAGTKDFREDWRFHVVAMRGRLGPALGANYPTSDRKWAVQVFAGDTLFTPMDEQAGCEYLSQTDPSHPAYAQIWTEAYRVCGKPYDPNSPFQQRAVQDRLGSPLSGVYTAQYGGANYQIQVFGLDTLYAGPDGNIQRMSQLPKPPDVMAWQPGAAAPPPPPSPIVHPPAPPASTAVRDLNWPPFPNFNPLPSRRARDEAFGGFQFAPASGRFITILGDWVPKNIIDLHIPQLERYRKGGVIKCHRRVADQLKALWAAWEASGLLNLVLTYDGDFVARVMAGNPNEVSMHSYGSAFDINYKTNGFMVRAPLVGDAGSVRALVPIANQHGFYWGGHFRYRRNSDVSDGMHFEWARPM